MNIVAVKNYRWLKVKHRLLGQMDSIQSREKICVLQSDIQTYLRDQLSNEMSEQIWERLWWISYVNCLDTFKWTGEHNED